MFLHNFSIAGYLLNKICWIIWENRRDQGTNKSKCNAQNIWLWFLLFLLNALWISCFCALVSYSC